MGDTLVVLRRVGYHMEQSMGWLMGNHFASDQVLSYD